MSIPNVRVNNFVIEKHTLPIDIISKVYIICEWILGVNRLPVIFNMKSILYNVLTLAFSLVFNVLTFFYIFTSNPKRLSNFVVRLSLMEYFICSFLGFLTWKSIKSFYSELHKFDKDIGVNWNFITYNSKCNFMQTIGTLVYLFIITMLPYQIDGLIKFWSEILTITCTHVLENYFYGHLLSLLVSRLRLIRILLLSSFTTKEEEEINSVSEKDHNSYFKNIISLNASKSKVEMKKLMQLYNNIIEAYDLLNKAIKAQILVIFSIIFVTSLTLTYNAALKIINDDYTWANGIFDVGMAVTDVVPVIVPCVFGEKIHTEVLLLRSALYSRIYKNVFDKSNRSIATSLLALTEARTLTFSIFRMIDINITLPIKFLGLLASYLVILLQFKKVIAG
ncbi:unnamed protein product [Parnassius mnemosyne]|uniref:Gustatory receptor n=1 Tax=Parnassius mnemosyne TaxID=213953 RepID=A0AAV1KXU9_9NEOP